MPISSECGSQCAQASGARLLSVDCDIVAVERLADEAVRRNEEDIKASLGVMADESRRSSLMSAAAQVGSLGTSALRAGLEGAKSAAGLAKSIGSGIVGVFLSDDDEEVKERRTMAIVLQLVERLHRRLLKGG